MDLPKNENDIQRLMEEKHERLKELSCINITNQIIREGKEIEETLRRIVHILPKAWQYPGSTVARISFKNGEYRSAGFKETEWKLSQSFTTIDNFIGEIDIFYLKKFADSDEGPFLLEERNLIDNLATIICNYLNTLEAKKILRQSNLGAQVDPEVGEFKKPADLTNRKLLQKFLNKQNANRDIFHDLMPYKVKEILLVATLYDAFSIEKEGRFSEHILGEYHQLNLTSMPRVTGVSNYDEALIQLNKRHYDLVILMIGSDRVTPLKLAKTIKSEFTYIPVYVLLNNNLEVSTFKSKKENFYYIDKLFVWNGDSTIFFAMVKLLEDRVNVENDTQIGLVKVILLVEDSEKYYSRYLPLLYNSVMDQTKRIIDDVSTDDLFKVLRLRARPKILLATSYEESMEIIKNYGESILCLITDVKFFKEGKLDDQAGFQLVKQVKSQYPALPTVIQSSDNQNSKLAFELKSIFINKNSDTLIQDIKSFISHHLGFGNFEYRDPGGRKIAEARSLREFEKQIETVPLESLIYHGKRNHFSLWLMARGEIKIAKLINPVKVSDFEDPNEFRNYLKYAIKKYRNESNTGKIVNFEESALLDETNIVSLGMGALGGKGRGLAFINTLIYNLNFSDLIENINIRTPRTSFIGTDEFDIFLEKNNLHDIIHGDYSYEEIKEMFIKGELSYHLEKKLKALLKIETKPLAIRSSSLLEDSTTQPFAGIFETFFLPNNNVDFDIRFSQLTDAIKLVYASIYSNESRSYFTAINYKLEEEKMGIVIQEVVGNQYENYFYPHISGTAQSHNYYPVAHMEPEDGFAIAALGLGHYVVSGEKAHRFSPKYPNLEINTPKILLRDTQVDFFALDLHKQNLDLLHGGSENNLSRLSISEAEKHGTLNHIASVYDPDNDRIMPGLDTYGPRIIDFADILKYNYAPLSETINFILDIGKEALGCPVEIEYGLDLNKSLNGKPSFYLLQIKPLLGSSEEYSIDLDSLKKEELIVFAEKSMGNGKLNNISDLVYVREEHFDKMKTKDVVTEINRINNKLLNENLRYILIGPGRWGTRDPFIGIPVGWADISGARIIIETSLPNFPLDASLGSHFFHNVTSMNIGYLSIQYSAVNEFIDWDYIKQQELVEESKYLRHVRFKEPLCVLMDGKKRISVIYKDIYSKKISEL
ncbi:MAG: pyruvate, phosphate dikinase [Bacteroidales bacterium]|nr:pyruvate, phosphate dikinase [Bacteroidales bacterium]MCF8389717.1 pyruvate, phosphate dikinase [Bacteroidales bacterium]